MKRTALIASVAVSACLVLPEPDQFGAHVILAVDPELTVCGGTLAHMDEFVARLSSEFSVSPPTGDDRYTFYLLANDRFHERSYCPDGAGACERLGATYSPYAPNNHEFVHSIAEEIGDPRPIFSEGLAVAFEGLASAAFAPAVSAPLLDVRTLLGLTSGTQLLRVGGYPTAGAFTSYLIQTHGLDAYLRMYAAVGPLEREHGIDQVFHEEFGVSLADAIAAFEAEPECDNFAGDAKLIECSAPELAWEGDRVLMHRSLACDQDDAVGPWSGDDVIVFHTVQIEEAGDYLLEVVGDGPNNYLSLQPCTICGGDGVTVAAGDSPEFLTLAAGRHALRLHGPASTRTSLGFRLERRRDP